MAIVVAASSSYTPTGAQDVSTTGATIPLPTGLAVGDYVVAAVYFGQLASATPAVVTPSGWTLINASAFGTAANRIMGLYGYKINNSAALTAIGTSFQAKAGATSTRVVGTVHRLTGVDLSVTPSLGALEFSGSGATSLTFNQPSAGTVDFFFLGTNNSQPSLPPVVGSTGGTIVVTNRSVANSGATADSLLTTFIGGTGATYSVSAPNHVSYGLGLTPLAASVVKTTTTAATFATSKSTTITAPALGNGLVAVVQHQVAGAITVTDNASNTWTRRAASENATPSAGTGQYKIDVWDCLAPAITTAPTSVTITASGSNEIGATIYEVTGVNWQASAQTTNVSGPQSGAPSITPAVGDLIITSVAYYDATNAGTVASPYTTVAGSGVSNTQYGSAYYIATATTASTPVWTAAGYSFAAGFASASYGLAASPTGNAAPTASFTKSVSSSTVSVDGSASSDSDGTIASYDWDWGDSTTHGTGSTSSHTYASDGTYTVLLTVTDNGGATGTSSQSVTINTAPTTRPLIVGTPTIGQQTVTTAKNVTIPKPTGVADGEWLVASLRSQDALAATDFTLAGWTRVGPAFVASSAAGRLSGFYAKYIPTASAETATSYTFSWTGTNGGRAVGTIVRVQGADPTTLVDAYASAYLSPTITNGSQLASYTVPDSNGLQLAIAMNEQTSPNASETVTHSSDYTLVQFVPSISGTSVSRTTLELYQKNQDAGSTTAFSVTWAATSSQNVQSIVLRGSRGTNIAPIAGFTTAIASFTVSATSTASDSDGTIASYDYDWGDSTTHATTANASHTYTTTGVYTITQTVTDNGGATATSTASISVPASASPVPHFGTGDSTTATTAAGTTLGGTKPTNVTNGDLLVACIYSQGGTSVSSVPTGWTLAASLSSRVGGVYTKPIPTASSETATSYAWTMTSSSRMILDIFRVTGADLSTPIDVAGTQAAEVSSLSSFSDTSITINYANSLLLSFNFWNNSSNAISTISPPSGMTAGDQVSTPTTTNTSGTLVAYQGLITAGATGTRAFSYSPSAVNGAGLLVAIKQSSLNPVASYTSSSAGKVLSVDGTSSTAVGAATIVSYDWDWGDSTTHATTATAIHTYASLGTYTVILTVTDSGSLTGSTSKSLVISDDGYAGIWRDSGGVNHPGMLYYWDGATKHPFSSTLTNIFQPVTVTQFLSAAHLPWFSAHRGFSYSYPEETLYGYRGTTDWGMKAIEVSVQYSADGTPWCFHDATTDRTTGVSGTISSMTDAQISVLNNFGSTATGNTSQPSRPTAKFVDVVNTYYKTHVIIVEDKTYTHTTAMLNLLDSYGTSGRPASDIFIWKVASSSSKTNFFDPAAARGYHRWAYIFDATMSTEFPALPASGKADMIGMDFNSSDATLSSAISLCISNGVMPTGHIITSTTQRDRLLGLGMKGLMMANKDAIPPWYNLWIN